jgi:hypothetical protein
VELTPCSYKFNKKLGSCRFADFIKIEGSNIAELKNPKLAILLTSENQRWQTID